VESAAWGLVARWGCETSAAHEVAAAAVGGAAASILRFTSFTVTSLGMINQYALHHWTIKINPLIETIATT